MAAEREEIGVVPYIKRNNSYRFIIVTARKHPGRWIFPKGQPERDKSSREIAVNEAFEEAGIIGTIRGRSIKCRVKKKGETIVYKMYPFRISKVCRKWPERKIRMRKFVKADKARKKLSGSPYADILKEFLKKHGE